MSKLKYIIPILVVVVLSVGALLFWQPLADNTSTSQSNNSNVLQTEDYLANADASLGRKSFRVCSSCHSTSKGGRNRIGPNLWNILTRGVGAKKSFRYSRTFNRYAETQDYWNIAELDRFLKSPRNFFPDGNISRMNFSGLRNIKDRANVIEYLRTLDDNPIQLVK